MKLQEHCFGQYNNFPEQLNTVIEIPRTSAMRTKYEVNFSTAEKIVHQKIDNPLPIYWHYGAAPQTISDDMEPADVVVFTHPDHRAHVGMQMSVRPIGMYNVSDGWEMYDHKIIAVPNTPEYAHITDISQLPAVPNPGKLSAVQLLEAFFETYRADDKELVKSGWSDQKAAMDYLALTRERYRKTPKAILGEEGEGNLFDFSNRVFITPPPPLGYQAETSVGDALLDMEALSEFPADADYGPMLGREKVREAMKSKGVNRSRSQLAGIDREEMIQEKLALAKNLQEANAKAYTISSDPDWIARAKEAGINATLVEGGEHVAENVEGLSGQTTDFLHYKRDGINILVAAPTLGEKELRTRLTNLGIMGKDEKMVVLHPPSELIPYAIPNSRGKTVSQLSDWMDFGYGVLPDIHNQPHLFISESIKKVAKATGKLQALDKFVAECGKYFDTVDFVGCTNKYGAPTNFIDTGMAVITPNCISNEGLALVEARLQRKVLKSPCAQHVNIGQPGPRCASFPINGLTYNLLRENGLNAVVGKEAFDTLHDQTSEAYRMLLDITRGNIDLNRRNAPPDAQPRASLKR
jgi:inorganic pyrophosphatase